MSAKTFSSPHSSRCEASEAYDDDEAHFLAPAFSGRVEFFLACLCASVCGRLRDCRCGSKIGNNWRHPEIEQMHTRTITSKEHPVYCILGTLNCCCGAWETHIHDTLYLASCRLRPGRRVATTKPSVFVPFCGGLPPEQKCALTDFFLLLLEGKKKNVVLFVCFSDRASVQRGVRNIVSLLVARWWVLM